MKTYLNRSGRSGVVEYETGSDSIKVRFIDSSKVYVYTYRSAGVTHVEEMKSLAENGEGLATYIARHVKELYECTE